MSSSPRYGLVPALTSALTLGLASTFGDWIWSRYLTDGAILPALVHGALFFLLLAVVLGLGSESRQTTRRLLWTLPIAGLALAAAFYPLARVLGYLPALLLSWVTMWVVIVALRRWAARLQQSIVGGLVSGIVAAVGSGLAFWSVSGLWTQAGAFTSYWLRGLAWTWAFLPGFLAVYWQRQPASTSPAEE